MGISQGRELKPEDSTLKSNESSSDVGINVLETKNDSVIKEHEAKQNFSDDKRQKKKRKRETSEVRAVDESLPNDQSRFDDKNSFNGFPPENKKRKFENISTKSPQEIEGNNLFTLVSETLHIIKNTEKPEKKPCFDSETSLNQFSVPEGSIHKSKKRKHGQIDFYKTFPEKDISKLDGEASYSNKKSITNNQTGDSELTIQDDSTSMVESGHGKNSKTKKMKHSNKRNNILESLTGNRVTATESDEASDEVINKKYKNRKPTDPERSNKMNIIDNEEAAEMPNNDIEMKQIYSEKTYMKEPVDSMKTKLKDLNYSENKSSKKRSKKHKQKNNPNEEDEASVVNKEPIQKSKKQDSKINNSSNISSMKENDVKQPSRMDDSVTDADVSVRKIKKQLSKESSSKACENVGLTEANSKKSASKRKIFKPFDNDKNENSDLNVKKVTSSVEKKKSQTLSISAENSQISDSEEEENGLDYEVLETYIPNLDFTPEPVEFDIPPLHANESVSNMPESERERFRSEGVMIKTGHFTKEEDELIIANYKTFTRQFSVNNSFFLLGINQTSKQTKRLNFTRAKHFNVRLGKGLNDRTLHSIYHRARHLLDPRRTKKALKKSQIQDLKTLQNRHGNKWVKIGQHMNRSRQNCQNAFQWHEKDVNKGHWTKEEDCALIEAVKIVSEKSKLDPKEDSNFSWHEVAKLVPTRNFSQCRLHWGERLIDSGEKWNKTHSAKLVYYLSEVYDFDSEEKIDWRMLHGHFKNVAPSYMLLQKKYRYMKSRIPDSFDKKSFSEKLGFLYCKYRCHIELMEIDS